MVAGGVSWGSWGGRRYPLIICRLSVPWMGQFLRALRSSLRLHPLLLGIKCAQVLPRMAASVSSRRPMQGRAAAGRASGGAHSQVCVDGAEVFFIEDQFGIFPAP